MSRVREVEVTNTSGTQINPATESTLTETNARLGDNVTNPTVNSVLGRLKNIVNTILQGQNPQTKYQVVLSQEESKVHEGNLYFVSYSQKVKKKKILQIVLTTPPAPQEVHFDRSSMIITSKESEIKVYVGMTTTGTLGDPIPVINANGNSPNVSPVALYSDPTGNINKGMLAFTEITDEDSKASTAFKKSNIIFKQGINYLMEIKSKGDSNIVTLPFEFFIHTPLS